MIPNNSNRNRNIRCMNKYGKVTLKNTLYIITLLAIALCLLSSTVTIILQDFGSFDICFLWQYTDMGALLETEKKSVYRYIKSTFLLLFSNCTFSNPEPDRRAYHVLIFVSAGGWF